jgi:FKBP-type peptidyl-prolyl cis-trans isomerase FkpA
MKKYILLASIASLLLFTNCSKDDTLSFDDQLALDVSIIDQHLSDKNIEADIHSSGIRVVVENEGTGEMPSLLDVVVVKYKGSFLNGSVFDQNTVGVAFDLDNLITAWQIMIPTLKEGGKVTIYTPSGYCYGSSGTGGIPANTILVFEIELLSIGRNFDEQLAIDTVKIDEYLVANEIDFQIHSSGIRYKMVLEGDGENPSSNQIVKVKYAGTLLNGTEFDSNSAGVEFLLSNLIQSWKIMIPEMKVGGKMIFYAPSVYCYGLNSPGGTIPPNSNLIFEVELLSIRN